MGTHSDQHKCPDTIVPQIVRLPIAAQIDLIVDLDNVDIWQHESNWAHL